MQMLPPLNRQLLSPREVEAALSVSHSTLFRLIARGELDARKLGSKTLITAASVARFIAQLPQTDSSRRAGSKHSGDNRIDAEPVVKEVLL